jgi:CIC family chloride channel protein
LFSQKPDDVVRLLTSTHHGLFAVTDEKQKLLGLVNFDTIRDYVFSPFKIKHSTLSELMSPAAFAVTVEDSLECIMDKFDESGTEYLPILKDDRYYGFISKPKILEAYRETLKDMVIE